MRNLFETHIICVNYSGSRFFAIFLVFVQPAAFTISGRYWFPHDIPYYRSGWILGYREFSPLFLFKQRLFLLMSTVGKEWKRTLCTLRQFIMTSFDIYVILEVCHRDCLTHGENNWLSEAVKFRGETVSCKNIFKSNWSFFDRIKL